MSYTLDFRVENTRLRICVEGHRSGGDLDEASYKDVEFAETVVVDRGFDAKVFRTEGEARAWLAR